MKTARELFEETCRLQLGRTLWDSDVTTCPEPSPYELLPALREHPDALEVLVPALRTTDSPYEVAVLALHGMEPPRRDDLVEGLEQVVRRETRRGSMESVYRLYAAQTLLRVAPERLGPLGLYRDSTWVLDLAKDLPDQEAMAAFLLARLSEADPRVVNAALNAARALVGLGTRRRLVALMPHERIEALTRHADPEVAASARDCLRVLFLRRPR